MVGGDVFAADASMIRADANKQNSTPNEDWGPTALDPDTVPRAVREYLDVLDDAAFSAASEITPKFTSHSDPASQWTGALKGPAFTNHNATADAHRAIYQPFNLVILMLAGIGMAVAEQITADVLLIAVLCLPATLLGSWIGARLYRRISANRFRRLVLALLLLSGGVLVMQALVG